MYLLHTSRMVRMYLPISNVSMLDSPSPHVEKVDLMTLLNCFSPDRLGNGLVLKSSSAKLIAPGSVQYLLHILCTDAGLLIL